MKNIICPTFISHCCTDIIIFYCQGHFPSAALRTLPQLCPSVMFTSFLTDCSIFFSAFSLPASPHLTTLKNILHIRVLESPRSQKLSNRHCCPPLSDTIVRKLLQLSVTHCSIPLSRLKNIHHFCQMSIKGAKSGQVPGTAALPSLI